MLQHEKFDYLRDSYFNFNLIVLSLVLAAISTNAFSMTEVDDCAELSTPGETYVLTAHVEAGPGICFWVVADDVEFDLNGYTISGPSLETGEHIGILALEDRTNIHGGSLTGFTGDFASSGVLLYNSEDSLVSNLNISHSAFGTFSWFTSYVGPGPRFEDLKIEDSFVGTLLCRAGNAEVHSNTFNDVAYAVDVECGGPDISISDNKMSGGDFGIFVGFGWFPGLNVTGNTSTKTQIVGAAIGWASLVENALIESNTFNKNGWSGLEIYNTYESIIADNTLLDNKQWGFYSWEAHGNVIENNQAHRNVNPDNPLSGSTGIELEFSSGNIISNNSANNNDYVGINLFFSSGNEVLGNNAHRSRHGIQVAIGSDYNVFSGNKTNNNHIGIRTGHTSDNRFEGNTSLSNEFDMLDSTCMPSCANTWLNNIFKTANSSEIQ